MKQHLLKALGSFEGMGVQFLDFLFPVFLSIAIAACIVLGL
jgi:hypothetical protein